MADNIEVRTDLRNELKTLLQALDGVYRAALKTLAREDITADQAERLAESSANIKEQLDHWLASEALAGKSAHFTPLIREVRERFLDFEGRAKEKRNDLLGAS